MAESLVNEPAVPPVEPAVPPVEPAVPPVEPAAPPAEPEKPAEGEKTPEELAAEKKAEEDKKAAEGAPLEGYADFKMPEGIELDKEALADFAPLAKELDLTQDQAQKLVDLKIKNDAASIERASKDQWDVWDKTQAEWQDTAKNDPDIGGAKFDESISEAKKAVDAYGSDALKELLDVTGAGNHVEFIKFAAKVGKDISEDKLRLGSPGTKEGSRASRIYDKTN